MIHVLKLDAYPVRGNADTEIINSPEADGEHVPKDHDGNVRHKEFEEMRKKHYEMKDIKGLLG